MMKATEIMIGDRLAYRGQYNAFDFRVEQVTKHKVGYHAEPGESRMHYLRLHEVQPIPLTTDILQHNGWEYSDEDEKFFAGTWCGGGLILQQTDEGFMIVAISDYDDEDTNRTPFTLRYVHELQHALRLCNIDKEITL
ncbi:MAG: hypothetical protein IJV24_07255 [Prevotella sp.]|nr:hypothetical protein [Prevotella sp.]